MARSAKASQLSITGSRFNGPSISSTSSSLSGTPNSEPGSEPKGYVTPTSWSDAAEEAYRFQVAGYRDEREYRSVRGPADRWPSNGYVKKLQRRDGNFYYFDQRRELTDRDVSKYRIYQY